MVAEGPGESTLPQVKHDLPARTSDQRGKAPVVEPRHDGGSASDKDSTFKDSNFAYALACSLQTLRDKEVLDQLLTPELRMRTFQGLVNVSFVLNVLSITLISTAQLHSFHICFCRSPNVFSN